MSKKIAFRFRWYHAGLLFLLFPAILMSKKDWQEAGRSLSLLIDHHQWVQVQAVVMSARMGKGMPLCGGQSPRIIYYYKIANKSYMSEQYGFQKCFPLSVQDKIAIINRYSPKQVITVYVNPQNPKEAVIVKDPYLNVLANFLIFLIILVGVILTRIIWLGLGGASKGREYQYTDYLPINKTSILTSKSSSSKTLGKAALWVPIGYLFIIPGITFVPSNPAFFPLWAIEIGIVAAWVWYYFQPGFNVHLHSEQIYIGDKLSFDIELLGDASTFNHIDITLNCEEHIYHKDHSRNINSLRKYIVYKSHIGQFQSGNLDKMNHYHIEIPQDEPPSLHFGLSYIKWILKIAAVDSKNVKQHYEYEIAISPKELK